MPNNLSPCHSLGPPLLASPILSQTKRLPANMVTTPCAGTEHRQGSSLKRLAATTSESGCHLAKQAQPQNHALYRSASPQVKRNLGKSVPMILEPKLSPSDRSPPIQLRSALAQIQIRQSYSANCPCDAFVVMIERCIERQTISTAITDDSGFG